MNAKFLLIFAISITLFSCKKDQEDIVCVTYNAIIAGDKSCNSIYYKDIDDINIRAVRSENSAYIYLTGNYLYLNNSYNLNFYFFMDLDGKITDYTARCYFNVYNGTEICLSENDSSNAKLFSSGDTINSKGNWEGIEGKVYYLAKYSLENLNSTVTADSSGEWNSITDGFLAIREISNKDTAYGWVRMDLFDHYNLIIKDYAIENQ
jgi:hypothetical protein